MDIKWSAIVGTRNTPHLIKSFVERWKKVVPNGEHYLIIVDSGIDLETKLMFNNHNLNNVYYHDVDPEFTLSDTYNYGVEKSLSNYISFLHNDIWLPEKYFDKLSESFEEDKICISRRIEPIVFSQNTSNEIVKYIDCGSSWDTIDEGKIYTSMNEIPDFYGSHLFNFFISFHKSLYEEVGGMDNLFDPMFCEDDDLHKRWDMLNKQYKLMGKVQFYHMPSQTSRYSDEYRYKTKIIEDISNVNYFRKWGAKTGDNRIPKIKNSLFVKYNPDEFNNIMKFYEMFFSKIYFIIEDNSIDAKEKIDKFIEENQKYTQFDLSKRIFIITSKELKNKIGNDVSYYSIILKSKIDFELLLELNDIVLSNNSMGLYKLDKDNILMIHKEINIENLINSVQISIDDRIDYNTWKELKKQREWKKSLYD